MLDPTHAWNKDLKPPLISFLVSLGLVFVTYFFAVKDFLPATAMDFILICLGFVQATIQLVFFFQLPAEDKPRWNLMILLFTLMVIVIIIGGSMWIMQNIDYNLMPNMSK